MKTVRRTPHHAIRIAALAALALVAALPACVTNDNVPPGARQDPVPGAAYPAIAIERPLQQFAVVDPEGIRIDRPTGTSPLRVSVPVRSTAYQQMSVQYRYLWFDGAGRPIGDSGWRFASLDPGLQSFFEANATTTRAEQYRLEVRTAR
ncbi:MAG: DUF1425 domain-containing protein [Planctomycetota bacterium]